MKGGAAAAVVLLLMFGGRLAYGADPFPCGSRPWIQIVLASDLPPGTPPFVDLLRAELASRGFDVCADRPQDPREPTATIEVVPRPGGLALNVEVRDAVTDKRVSRDVDLGAVPPDSQPLMLALASDELLRASWAELALRSSPPPSRPVPPAVAEVVRDSVRPDADRIRLGVAVMGEHFAAGTALYGADILVGGVLTRRLSADLGVGLRTGPTVAGADGDVGVSAVTGSLSARFTTTPPQSRLGLDAVARFAVERIAFTATPHPGALATPQAGYPLLADAGLSGWFRVLRRVRISAEVLADLPLRPVYATDGQVRVAGVAGVGVGGGVGIWTSF